MKAKTLFSLLSALFVSCAAPPDTRDLEQAITRASIDIYAGQLAGGVAKLEAVQPEALGIAREDLRLEYYLTQAHLAASLGDPFLVEPVSGAARSMGTGATRPSPAAHLVALIYHASAARALLASNRGGLDRDQVEGNLRLAEATAFARLGFHDIAQRAAEADPELLLLEKFETVLERYDLPAELATWLASMAFDALKGTDELRAYRFAILALEGQARFGSSLDPITTRRLERWILEGASVRFVCPQSGTPFVPGLRRSPRSGIPHYEYVPAPRR